MAKVNTHGFKMTGLRRASGDTEGNTRVYSGLTFQINYNAKTGYVWTDRLWGGCNLSVYGDKNIHHIATTYGHMTMQEIANRIARYMTEFNNYKERIEHD